jgi:PAS domain S-box-containing protein
MSTINSTGDGDEYRRRLYEARADDDLTLREFAAEALEIGVAYLGVEDAHFNRIESAADGPVHEVLAAGGGDLVPEGLRYDQATSFCRRTVEDEAPVSFADAESEGWADDPAYAEHGLSCYLGATVTVEGEPYGTVCFVSRDPRPEPFAPDERAFVELVARSIGRRLETRRRDRQLDRTERKYEALVTAAPDAVLLVDGETGDLVEVNAAAGDLLGVDRDQLVGDPALRWFPAADRDRLRTLFRAPDGDGADGDISSTGRFPDGTPIEVETADGDRVPVEVNAAPVELDGRAYVQAVLRDVSERRERQREIRLKDRAIEEAAVGIAITGLEEGNAPIQYVNRAFERLTGYDREELIGRDCRILQGETTADDPVAALGEAIAAREPHTTELLNYRADGSPFWNELTVAPVENAAGEVTHYVGFQRDVTERKRREHQVSVLNRVLRHNVRNRMNVVTGYADVLLDADASDLCDGPDGDAEAARTDAGPADGPGTTASDAASTGLARAGDGDGTDALPPGAGPGIDVSDLAGRIREAATDLTQLSDTARSVEEIVRDPGTPAPRNVAAVARSVAADTDADVRVSAPEEVRALATSHVETALSELVENAVEHAPDSPVELTVASTPDGVAVTVADEGPGLPPAERRLVEEGRETPLEHGDGLGLWLVYRVVADAGGRVTVDDGADGTAVTVRLQPADGRPSPAVGDEFQGPDATGDVGPPTGPD